jgi:addiction module RelE/StbE family toxin
MWTVLIERNALKKLEKAPKEICEKFDKWKEIVQFDGPRGLREIKGFRDHSLKGEWKGARSSSLNYQWRVIYIVNSEEIKILVLEVTPHDYRKKS